MAEQEKKKVAKPKLMTEELSIPEMMQEPPLEPSGGVKKYMSRGGGSGFLQSLFVSLLITVVVVFGLMPMMGGGSFVLKSDFDTNLGNVANSISGLVARVDKNQTSIVQSTQTIPDTINSAMAQTTQSLNQEIQKVASQISQYNSSIQSNSQKIEANDKRILELIQKVATLELAVSELTDVAKQYDSRIVALEAKKGIVTAEKLDIGVDVLERGIRFEDTKKNQIVTRSKIGLTIINNTGYDLEDFVVSLRVEIVNMGSESPYVYSYDGVGIWRIDEVDNNEVVLEWNLGEVDDGGEYNTVVWVCSEATDSDELTRLYASSSDIEVDYEIID
jgi:hypothetical protein